MKPPVQGGAVRIGDGIDEMLAKWKARAMEGVGTKEHAQAQRRIEIDKWIERCKARNIPRNIWTLVAGGHTEDGEVINLATEAILAIDMAIRKHRRFIVLSGPPGSGKTVALSRLLTRPDCVFTFDGEHGWFSDVGELFDDYKQPRQVFRRGWMPLVIDDLGTEDEKRICGVDDILQSRYAGDCYTFCSTNLSVQQIKDRYDARTISRLKEVGAFLEVRQVVRPDVGDFF